MKLCQLCKEKEANQTGSHLLSCFMVTSMLGERGEENEFLISSVGGDYRKNRKGEEIKEDNIFCHGCEQRLAYLEGYFSSEYTNKVDQENYKQNFPKTELNGKTFHTPVNMKPFAFHLLIYSIVWRAHLSTKPLFVGFRIPDEAAEHIRTTLNTVLPNYENYKVKGKYKDWIKDIDSVKDIVEYYPYVILKTELTGQDRTQNFNYFSDIEKSPYHIVINEFLILMNFGKDSTNLGSDDFFELSEKYDFQGLTNQNIDELKIGDLEFTDWEEVRNKIFNIVADKIKLRNAIRDCILIALKEGILPSLKYMEYCIECRKNNQT